MSKNLKDINKKLFHIQMLLEECTADLEKLVDDLDKSLDKSKGITRSSQFVFGE